MQAPKSDVTIELRAEVSYGIHVSPAQVTSSVYATPVITDLYSDGRKDIIVPGFVHYTEVLQVG